MGEGIPGGLAGYYLSGKPLSCEIDIQPWLCEFWPFDQIATYNLDYAVREYAPGYLGFASNGGGEMYAIAPRGAIVCLAFVGMSAGEELFVADNWDAFERMLMPASQVPDEEL